MPAEMDESTEHHRNECFWLWWPEMATFRCPNTWSPVSQSPNNTRIHRDLLLNLLRGAKLSDSVDITTERHATNRMWKLTPENLNLCCRQSWQQAMKLNAVKVIFSPLMGNETHRSQQHVSPSLIIQPLILLNKGQICMFSNCVLKQLPGAHMNTVACCTRCNHSYCSQRPLRDSFRGRSSHMHDRWPGQNCQSSICSEMC